MIEKLADIAKSVKKNKYPRESAKITSTKRAVATPIAMPIMPTTDTSNEVPLPGSNINMSDNSVTMDTTIDSRAAQEENHAAAVFSTGKYSASMSTAFGANFSIIY